jgi:hypothetical protein
MFQMKSSVYIILDAHCLSKPYCVLDERFEDFGKVTGNDCQVDCQADCQVVFDETFINHEKGFLKRMM